MRYVYLGTKGSDPALRDLACDPVKDHRGRCIRGNGDALVIDADGKKYVVIARRLRLRSKL